MVDRMLTHAPVAQRIERRFPKPCVGSSSLPWGISYMMGAMQMRYHLFFLASFAIFTVGFISDPEACYTDCIDDEATDVIRPEIIPTQPNPALAWSVVDTGTDGDPFAAFGRRPIDEPRIVPFGGFYQDPDRSTPHYGIDYTYPEAFLNFVPQPIYPIGPGIVTTVHTWEIAMAGGMVHCITQQQPSAAIQKST